ncbi:hypothetical protein BP5796_07709 [Coleophoma crateriformis]|uniref:Heterokaryon incompatibility domain-containing protein n=1 Tax=Coleophoma crateriformis TaxID=565419 RepID=A0A3D8RCC9_9HELO|nr:hypothetical protein BP5796_07709 [Coleophoma crateriformis]
MFPCCVRARRRRDLHIPTPAVEDIEIDVRPSEKYIYERLPSPSSLRLLLFSPDEASILETFEIDDCPPYIALSYTWGPPLETEESIAAYTAEPSCILRLNTPHGVQILEIPRNLEEGLQQATKTAPDVYFWADAICINQDDIPERSAQVKFMGDIYSKCTGTIVWLGKDTSNLGEFWELHKALVPRIYQYVQDNGVDAIHGGDWTSETLRRNLRHPFIDFYWPGYAQFYNRRRWFHRVWVIQEVGLSPLVMVLCGETKLDWEWMGYLAQFLAITGLAGDRLFGPEERKLADDSPLTIMPGRQMVMLNTLRSKCQNIGTNEWRETFAEAMNLHEPKTASLQFFYNCLGEMRSSKASDPRDKVYGTLGFLTKALPPGGQVLIMPDYTLEIEAAFTETASVFLQNLPGLAVLSEVEARLSNCPYTLPSWVPDFNNPFHRSLLGYAGGIYDACPVDRMPLSIPKILGPVLELTGACFDTVTAYSSILAPLADRSLANVVQQTLEEIQEYLELSIHPNKVEAVPPYVRNISFMRAVTCTSMTSN